MEKRCFESFEVFSCLKKVNPRILSTFKRSFSKKMGKKPSSHNIHTLNMGGLKMRKDDLRGVFKFLLSSIPTEQHDA